VKILVTVKRVTDYERKVKIAADGSRLLLDDMSFRANPFDEIAVEEALRLKGVHGGEVVLISVGPKDAATQIRQGLAMGADRGILVTAEEVDSDGVARLMVKLVQAESPDLIIMGKQATDDDANQAGQLLAGYLGWPQATFASKVQGLDSEEEKAQKPGIQVADGAVTVVREVDGGLETLKMPLPAVVTTDLRLNVPRFASLPGIMKAKKKEVKELSPAELGVDVTPKVRMTRYHEPPARRAGVIVKSVDELIEKLRNEAKVI
jgi:electron transfer flavoprotein beta subunit